MTVINPASGVPAPVAALPANPGDQQLANLWIDQPNGVRTLFQYDAASGYWIPLGPAYISAPEILTQENTVSNAYVDLATVGPQVALPAAPTGWDLLITYGFSGFNASAGQTVVGSPKLGAAATADSDGAALQSATAGQQLTTFKTIRRNAIAGGSIIKLQYRSTGTGAANFLNRDLHVQLLRGH